MAFRQQPEQYTIDQILLADDDVRNLLAQGRNPATKLLHLLRNFLSRFHELCKTENLGRTFDQVRHPEQRPALSVVEWVEGSRCDTLKVTSPGILRLRFAPLRMTWSCAPGRSTKSVIPGRARAHESSLQGNVQMAVSEDEGT